MALTYRKRIGSVLRNDNYIYVANLSESTGLNQSKLFDLAIDLLRKQLSQKDILTLISEHKESEAI